MSAPTTRALPVRPARLSPRRLSAHTATGGLVVVLLVLTVFSVATAVANASAAEKAQRSAAVSRWADQAEEGLAVQEDLADELTLEPDDDEVRAEQDAASAATRNALEEMATAAGDGQDRLATWLTLHDQYAFAVERLIVAAQRNPAGAEQYEEDFVDPHYDALETVVQDEARDRLAAADAVPASMGRAQRWLGAGYTSPAHLRGLPVHQLKIDRSSVAEMTSDHRVADIVRSIVELGHNLGLTTVAEGIEDQATWNRLSELGCDVAQGYFLCRPLPADQHERWFDSVEARALT